MLIWGRRHKSVRKDIQDNFVCKACGRAGKSALVVDYDYGHLYWLFRFAKNLQVHRVCDCGASYDVDKQGHQALFSRLGGNPIPAFDRFGGLALVLLVVGGFTYGYLSEAKRDGTGALVSEGQVSAFDIRLGDCFNDDDSQESEEAMEVSALHALPCTEPHDNEVFAVFQLDLDEFPEDDMGDIAFDGCLEYFEGFVGRDYETSSLDLFAIYPTRVSWSQRADREVVCAIYDLELEQLQGSMRDSGV